MCQSETVTHSPSFLNGVSLQKKNRKKGATTFKHRFIITVTTTLIKANQTIREEQGKINR